MPRFILPTVLSGQKRLPKPEITLFNCDKQAIEEDGLLVALRVAGITHVTLPIFNSPGHNATIDTPDKWRAQRDQLIKPPLDWCKANGFRVIGTGDSFFKDLAARQFMWNSPWALDITQEQAAFLSSYGIVDRVEMVDESLEPYAYGPSPFVDAWRRGAGPKLAWPNISPQAWEVSELADYTSRYRPCWGYRNLTLRDHAWMFHQYVRGVRPGWELSTLIWAVGPRIVRGEPLGGVKPQDVYAQFWLGMTYGASIFRVYAHNWLAWRNAVGSDDYQIGFEVGDGVWQKIIEACQSFNEYKDELLGAHFVPTRSGPWVWGGCGLIDDNPSKGPVFGWGINISDTPRMRPNGSKMVKPGDVYFWNRG